MKCNPYFCFILLQRMYLSIYFCPSFAVFETLCDIALRRLLYGGIPYGGLPYEGIPYGGLPYEGLPQLDPYPGYIPENK